MGNTAGKEKRDVTAEIQRHSLLFVIRRHDPPEGGDATKNRCRIRASSAEPCSDRDPLGQLDIDTISPSSPPTNHFGRSHTEVVGISCKRIVSPHPAPNLPILVRTDHNLVGKVDRGKE